MKLFLRISVAVISLSVFAGTVSATTWTWDLRNWMDNLNTQIPFGYAVTQKITVDQISPDKIDIKSPVIQDELGNKITKYTVMFSQYPISQILDNTSLLDQSKEKTFDFATVGTDVTMELTVTGDLLNPNVVYYISVIPKNQNWILGEISNEIRFKLASQTSWEGTSTAGTWTVAHTSAGANMSLANITHTITNNKVTLRWTAIAGSDSIDIFLWNPTSSLFERLSSVNMAAESYTFTLTRNGEYIVNFMPNNWGTEFRYTFVANGVVATPGITPTTPPIIGKIPKTGPKENILVTFGIALVLYLVYRRVKSKAKH